VRFNQGCCYDANNSKTTQQRESEKVFLAADDEGKFKHNAPYRGPDMPRRWSLMTLDERKRANAASTAKNRDRLREWAQRAGQASAQWFFAQPPDNRAFIVSRLIADGVRARAIKMGRPPPIIFERELDHRDDGNIVVDISKAPDFNPDPRLYRAMPGGGNVSIEAEEIWNHDVVAIRRRAKNAKRRARRAARKAKAAAAAAGEPDP
jgi:hypothetical protein